MPDSDLATKAAQLRSQVAEAEQNLKQLRDQLAQAEADIQTASEAKSTPSTSAESPPREQQEQRENTNGNEDNDYIPADIRPPPPPGWSYPLHPDEYTQYARQLIVPSVGVAGQSRLRAAAVLVVGAGGLGCPAALYLAGAGVGTLGVVDGDVVEPSNLHRQVGHTMAAASKTDGRVGAGEGEGSGTLKVDSLIARCRALNPHVAYRRHPAHLAASEAAAVVGRYDIVLDCTDNPAARYLVSDACVLLGKPLVSASALRTDGQLMVLNDPPVRPPGGRAEAGAGDEEEKPPQQQGGPCYRCIYPRPPPADSVVTCGEGGILGPVVGVMGVLQALEAIKLVTRDDHDDDGPPAAATAQPRMLLFSALSPDAPFRSIRMRGRRPDCAACSPTSATVTLSGLAGGGVDYVRFCGATRPLELLRPDERVSATEYSGLLSSRRSADARTTDAAIPASGRSSDSGSDAVPTAPPHLLLDVREKVFFDISSIPGAVNVPLSVMQRSRKRVEEGTGEGRDGSGSGSLPPLLPDWLPPTLPPDAPIYTVCHVGNDSQVAARKLEELGLGGARRFIGDIRGGMRAWKREVDRSIPFGMSPASGAP